MCVFPCRYLVVLVYYSFLYIDLESSNFAYLLVLLGFLVDSTGLFYKYNHVLLSNLYAFIICMDSYGHHQSTEQFHHRDPSCYPFVAITNALSPSHSNTLATCSLFSISVVLSFQGCYINGIKHYVTFEMGSFHST